MNGSIIYSVFICAVHPDLFICHRSKIHYQISSKKQKLKLKLYRYKMKVFLYGYKYRQKQYVLSRLSPVNYLQKLVILDLIDNPQYAIVI